MKFGRGVRVREVTRISPFFKGGVRSGDLIRAINGNAVNDELDFQFFSADYLLNIRIQRDGKTISLTVERTDGGASGVVLDESPVRRCANRCIFCFIDQMPSGLRRSLYVKDEDIRLSLLNGNYVTLSNFKNRDLEQIATLGLSPLYISVHATDLLVRRRMLGNKKTPDIMQQLDFLAENDISFHTQIVVCPGFNDGTVLNKTIRDLLIFRDALQSVAVVPVGVTRFRATPLQPVTTASARKICRQVTAISDRAMVRDGLRKVFLADELFIRAGLSIPEREYYGEYPQIENGVGLIRQLLDRCAAQRVNAKTPKRGSTRKGPRRLLVTSVSAYPFIRQALDCLSGGDAVDCVAVVNDYFGTSVTVAGLLTARDVVRVIKSACRTHSYDEVVLPAVMFNFAGHTLDGYSAQRIARQCGKKVMVAETIQEVL